MYLHTRPYNPFGTKSHAVKRLCWIQSVLSGKDFNRCRPFGLVIWIQPQIWAFSVVGPSAWNDLPFELRSLLMAHPSKFYISLKSFLFVRDWAGSASG